MNNWDCKIRLITESLIFFDHRKAALGYSVGDLINDCKSDCAIYGRRVICRDESNQYFEIKMSHGMYDQIAPIQDNDPIINKIKSYFEVYK